MSVQMQKQIKDNSTSVSEYFSDLYKWSEEKNKEEKRRGLRAEAKVKGKEAVLAKHQAEVAAKPATKPDKAKKTSDARSDEAIARDKLPMPQYYNDWQCFDVDGELEKMEDEAFEEQKAMREQAEAEKDRILDQLAISGDGERGRTTKARPKVKISVRTSGRRAAPVDLAIPKKEEANRYFAEGRFREACVIYSQGLDLLEKYEPPERSKQDTEEAGNLEVSKPGDCAGEESQAIALKVTLLANRAAALLKLEEWREAAEDTTEALRFDPNHHKSILRRGCAMARLKRWGLAARDLQRALDTDPTDKKAQADLSMARRMLAEQLKESRASAKANMCDPTRDPVMPARRIKVRAMQREPGNISFKANGVDDDDTAPERRRATGSSAAPASAQEDGAGAATASGAGGASSRPAAARQPYVPRSVRVRGRQQPVHMQSSSGYPEDAPESASTPAATAQAASGVAPGMNFYTFEAQWTRLRAKPGGRAALLRRIGARALPALFRESLDAELLSSIVEVLGAELRQDEGGDATGKASFAMGVMEALVRTARFDLSISTLSESERDACRKVLDGLEATASEDALALLRLAYDPPAPERPVPDAEEEDPDDQEEEMPRQNLELTDDEEEGKKAQAAAESSVAPAMNFSLDDCD